MKIFISGKITGIEHNYLRLFQEAEHCLKSMGFDVVNPTKLEHNHDLSWESYMKTDLKSLLECDGVFMLNNWKESRGAKLEHKVAKKLKLKIIFQDI